MTTNIDEIDVDTEHIEEIDDENDYDNIFNFDKPF